MTWQRDLIDSIEQKTLTKHRVNQLTQSQCTTLLGDGMNVLDWALWKSPAQQALWGLNRANDHRVAGACLLRVGENAWSVLYLVLCHQTKASLLNAIDKKGLTKELTRMILKGWAGLYTGWSVLHLVLYRQTDASVLNTCFKAMEEKALAIDLARVRPDGRSGLRLALCHQTDASILNTCFKAIKKTDLSKELTRVIPNSWTGSWSGLHLVLYRQTDASVLNTCFKAMEETDLSKELMRVRPDGCSGLHLALCHQTDASVLNTCFNAMKKTDLSKELTRVILNSWERFHAGWASRYAGWSGLQLALQFSNRRKCPQYVLPSHEKKKTSLST